MRAVAAQYKKLFRNREFVLSFIGTVLLLVIALTINLFAGIYATERASGSVSDIILSNIPVINVDMLFVYAPIIFWIIITVYCLIHPHDIPFVYKSTALFIIIRSIFITLTHIGPFPDHINIDTFSLIPNFNFFIFSSGADLFFSGHTGLPFLLALIFWDYKHIRIFCFISSVFFAVIVLLGHLHYSIDVLSAFFITYTIYHIALRIFPQDRLFFARSKP